MNGTNKQAPAFEIFGFDSVTVSLMSFNFFSAVGIVFANKYVFHTYGYNFATFVTSLHFVTTSVGGRICLQLGMYKVKGECGVGGGRGWGGRGEWNEVHNKGTQRKSE